MSTLNITDLLRELQAGEEARARIPQLQEAVNAHADRADKLAVHNQGLETSIIEYKRTIDGLNAKVRSLEVERDDAGFRELEASDKVNTLMQTLRALAGNIDDTVRSIDPPKPEPIAQQTVQNASVPMTEEPGVSQSTPPGERAADPTNHTADAPVTATSQFEPVTSQSVSITTSAPTLGLGQSDANPPSAPSTEATLPFASGADASPSAPAPSTNDPQAYRPFGGDAVGADNRYANAGKPWYDRPRDMSMADWIASGGQE